MSDDCPCDFWGSFTTACYRCGWPEADEFDGGTAAATGSNQETAFYDNLRLSSTSPVIDDFGDDDIDEYSGDTGSGSTISSPVYESDNALEVQEGGNEIVSTSGLPNYAEQGDKFEARHNLVDGAICRFGFGVQDADNGYSVGIDSSSDTLSLFKTDAGTTTTLDSEDITIPTNQWIRSEVTWGSNDIIVVRLFDSDGTELTSDEPRAEDSTYTSGGILWAEDSTPLS